MKKTIITLLVAGLLPIAIPTSAHAKVCGFTLTTRTNHRTGHTYTHNVYRCSGK